MTRASGGRRMSGWGLGILRRWARVVWNGMIGMVRLEGGSLLVVVAGYEWFGLSWEFRCRSLMGWGDEILRVRRQSRNKPVFLVLYRTNLGFLLPYLLEKSPSHPSCR